MEIYEKEDFLRSTLNISQSTHQLQTAFLPCFKLSQKASC